MARIDALSVAGSYIFIAVDIIGFCGGVVDLAQSPGYGAHGIPPPLIPFCISPLNVNVHISTPTPWHLFLLESYLGWVQFGIVAADTARAVHCHPSRSAH
jgi:hypothetical protein